MKSNLSNVCSCRRVLRVTGLVVAAMCVFLSTSYRVDAQSDSKTNVPPYLDPDRPMAERVDDLVGRMTIDEKISQLGNVAPAIERLGIPEYDYWNEGLHGVARAGLATVFPQAIGMAATWNTDLIHQIGNVVSDECRAKHHEAVRHGERGRYSGLTLFSPNINIFRDPRWGRGQETYGEDPYLTSQLAVQFIRGLQGSDPRYLKTVATAKHFAAHSGPEATRDYFNAVVSPRDLRMTYLPAFKACVTEGNVASVMGAYNRLNGEPTCASPWLLQKTLRERWGFDGYVVSDCGAVADIFETHRLTKTAADAAIMAFNNGCDLICGCTCDELGEKEGQPDAVAAGMLAEKIVDRALKRVMTSRFRLGMFDPPKRVSYAQIPMSVVDCPEHRRLALKAARQSLVLLKNQDKLLPLDRDSLKSIAVIGPTADETEVLLGNYNGTPAEPVSILTGIRALAGEKIKVHYAKGCELVGDSEDDFSAAVAAAKRSQVAVVVVGLSQQLEGEAGQEEGNPEGVHSKGDRPSLDLPPVQQKLVERIVDTGTPVVMVLLGGSAISVNWADEHVPAIIEAWYPGQAGGTAVAEVLFGRTNPSGRLPVTFYRSVADLPAYDDYAMANRTYRYFQGDPLYRFGHGLSYTTFTYGNLRITPKTIQAGQPVSIEVEVANTGPRAGDEVVQLYLKDVEASQPVPQIQLQGFTRIHLEPGEKRRVQFNLTPRQMSFADGQGDWRLEPGEFQVWVGGRQPDLKTDTQPANVVGGRFFVSPSSDDHANRRTRESFDDDWRFARYGLQADGSRLAEPKNMEQPDAVDSTWKRLDLPHDFAIEGPFRLELAGETGKLPWRGIGWYRKQFTLPRSDAGKRIFVDFDGAMADAKVWCNGHLAGGWPYGYTSFRVDLTPYVRFGGENLLAVRVDTENWGSRWYPGAGIYRHTWLVKTDPVHVGHWGTFVTTPEVSKDQARVNIAVTGENQTSNEQKPTVETEIFELRDDGAPGALVAVCPEQMMVLRDGQTETITSETTIQSPKLWDLSTPNRYLARTHVKLNGKTVDVYDTPFGIRSIKITRPGGLLLNGRRVQVQGVCNHHDLGALGAALNDRALERQLEILKSIGCNAIRTSHNPPAPELLDLADRMGFLVWDEAFDCWTQGKCPNDYSRLFNDWHVKDLQAMIRRDRNHPCVFIWSIGNEVREEKDVALTRHLAEVVRTADPTRPVSNGYSDVEGARRSGAALALDVMGVNYSFGRQDDWDASPRYKNMPTIGSETSSCVSSRGEYFFGTNRDRWQVTSYDTEAVPWGCVPDDQFRVNARLKHLLGEFVWTGFDYLGEPTPYGSNDATQLLNFRNDPEKRAELERELAELARRAPPSRSSYFGLIDLAGFPKDRYYLYQSQWQPDVPMAHLLPHWNWPERIGRPTPVHLYTSGDEAELFLCGESQGKRVKRPGQDFRLVWDAVVYQPGELKAVVRKDGKPWATAIVKTTGRPERLLLKTDRSTIKADGRDLAFITVRVADSEGLTVPRSNPRVTFTIDGPGEIVATDNGDPTSFEPFHSPTRHAFNGLALVIVRAKKGHPGTFTVTARSDGLLSGEAKIVAE